MAELSAFLRSAARTPFAWGGQSGGSDCLLTPADWWMVNTGNDPASAWRGTYSDEGTARAIVDGEGGMIEFTTLALTSVGAFPVDLANISRGDVGLVEAMDDVGRIVLVGGICTGRRWAARSLRGMRVGFAVPHRAWRWAAS